MTTDSCERLVSYTIQAVAAQHNIRKLERRLSRRFPLRLNVRYRIARPLKASAFDDGTILNMSSAGILLRTKGAVLTPPTGVDIEVDWPAERNDGAALKLVLNDRVLRSERAGTYALSIKRHAFVVVAGESS